MGYLAQMKTKSSSMAESRVLRYILIMLLVCVMALMLFSFVTSPFTGDIEVFMAAANQVKYQDATGLMAVFQSWELKGIGNRILMYVLYVCAQVSVPFSNVISFQIAVKSLYAFVVLAGMIVTSLLIAKERKCRLTLFVVEYFAVFATYEASQLQAEMTCVVLALLVFALLVHESSWSTTAAGMVAATFFFFKSVLILLPFASFACYVLYSLEHDTPILRRGVQRFFGSFAVTELVLLVLVRVLYPQEFVDMGAAAEFQYTLLSSESNVSLQTIWDSLSNGFTQAVVAQPMLLVGLASSLYLAVIYIQVRKTYQLFSLIALWLVPLDIIVVSNTYFVYHFYLLMLPGIVSVVILCERVPISAFVPLVSICSVVLPFGARLLVLKDAKPWGIINYSTVLLLIVHVMLLTVILACSKGSRRLNNVWAFLVIASCAFLWLNYSSCVSLEYRNEKHLQRVSVNECAEVIPQDFGDEPVLFLDAGIVPFYADAPSYSKYFYNLPMQRWRDGEDWGIQKSEYQKLMDYTGKYVIWTSWFGVDKYPELQEKLDNEYEMVDGGSAHAFTPDWNPFYLCEPNEEDAIWESSAFHLMVRK